MRHAWVLLALCACGRPMARSLADTGAIGSADAGVISADAGAASTDAGVVSTDPGPGADGGPGMRAPSLAGCPMFPPGNEWNRDVSSDPVDPHSADYLAFMG